MTLYECVSAWITRRQYNLAPSTVSGYRLLNRKYIEPSAVGGMAIEEITEDDVSDLLVPLIGEGHTRQAQLLQTLVVAVVRDCVRRRLLPYNPLDCMEKVKHVKQMTAWLTEDQARRLLETSRANKDPFYVAWLLMICCGLRRGEMLGLRWSDIDVDRAVLHVERQRIRVDGRILVTRPKSPASIRDIPLSDHLLSILRLHAVGSGAIIECSEHQFADGLDQALKAGGLPRVTLHGLRHTFASVAAAEEVPVKSVQLLMGHSHFQVTADVYAHVADKARRRAAEMITGAMIGARLEIV